MGNSRVGELEKQGRNSGGEFGRAKFASPPGEYHFTANRVPLFSAK
jgi:hypothetical protein